jgi:hypothetical protein
MRASFCLAAVLSLALISVSSEAKTKPKVKVLETKIEISGQITVDSCGADTNFVNRAIYFTVQSKGGKVHPCRIDADHPANADWVYLKGLIVDGKQICFSGVKDEKRERILVKNISDCGN